MSAFVARHHRPAITTTVSLYSQPPAKINSTSHCSLQSQITQPLLPAATSHPAAYHLVCTSLFGQPATELCSFPSCAKAQTASPLSSRSSAQLQIWSSRKHCPPLWCAPPLLLAAQSRHNHCPTDKFLLLANLIGIYCPKIFKSYQKLHPKLLKQISTWKILQKTIVNFKPIQTIYPTYKTIHVQDIINSGPQFLFPPMMHLIRRCYLSLVWSFTVYQL